MSILNLWLFVYVVPFSIDSTLPSPGSVKRHSLQGFNRSRVAFLSQNISLLTDDQKYTCTQSIRTPLTINHL